MKKGKMALLALVGLVGVSSAFASKHKAVAGRTYGILSKSGSNWNVELFTGTCTDNPATQCGVVFDDGGVTRTTIPVGAGDPVQLGQKYQH